METERCYSVYCQEDIANKLKDVGHLQRLQERFGVGLAYSQEYFMMTREQTSLEFHQQAKHYLINLIRSYKRTPFKYQWLFMSAYNWEAFEEEASEKIEAAFRAQTSCVINHRGKMYNIDPFLQLKVSLDGRETTEIYRMKTHPLTHNLPTQNPPRNPNRGGRPQRGRANKEKRENTMGSYWVYYEKNSAKSFPREISQMLEEAFVNQQPLVSFPFFNSEVEVNLREMNMRNTTTGEDTKVARY